MDCGTRILYPRVTLPGKMWSQIHWSSSAGTTDDLFGDGDGRSVIVVPKGVVPLVDDQLTSTVWPAEEVTVTFGIFICPLIVTLPVFLRLTRLYIHRAIPALKPVPTPSKPKRGITPFPGLYPLKSLSPRSIVALKAEAALMPAPTDTGIFTTGPPGAWPGLLGVSPSAA